MNKNGSIVWFALLWLALGADRAEAQTYGSAVTGRVISIDTRLIPQKFSLVIENMPAACGSGMVYAGRYDGSAWQADADNVKAAYTAALGALLSGKPVQIYSLASSVSPCTVTTVRALSQ